ncbi:unnamed protein product [Prorocentrum cordatum]|uniref:Uncharacterized protein n=1 Tax=Prorocentrum cordatum TaxID=2364126 RepID=A0ABN9QVR4_9DINO|nr:unnamed protein product [Polarella glacialis]
MGPRRPKRPQGRVHAAGCAKGPRCCSGRAVAGASALPRMRAFAGAQTGNLSRRSARRWAERSRKGAPRGWTERRKGKEEGQGGGARSDERPHARTCRKFTTP